MAVEIDTSAFTEEAYELLSELEDSLLELEASPTDKELISRVFRAMHTIKGSGAMFGFEDVAAFTHEVETVFDMARNGTIPVTKELINLTLAARDQIRSMLDAAAGGSPPDKVKEERIIAGLRGLVPGGGGGAAGSAASKTVKKVVEDGEGPHVYRVRFTPHGDLFANGTNPILLLDEIRTLGSCRMVAFTDKIPDDLEEMDPERCYTSWEIFVTTDKGENAIRDVFIFVEDQCDLNIRLLDRDELVTEEEGNKKLGEILVERGDIKADVLQQAMQPLGQRLVAAGLVNRSKVDAALAEQQAVQEKKEAHKQKEPSSVRVPSEKLDHLVNLVGELVTVQARLTQTSIRLSDHDLQLVSEEIERLTGELRDNTMSIRMLAIGSTFSKFKRLVRDLSNELGKQIEMTTAGEETELDKTVIDQLNDPLVHVIRNSIDHGIEMPDERAAVGKPAIGIVHLSAEHSGANVLIKVTDDGRGLDAKKLRAKGIERGLVPPDTEMTEKEAFQLIFAPGFSTAAKITNVSGRGVGMDVVRKSIDALRGSIEVHSELGKGSTITFKLPLTLAIIEGLLVRIGSDSFVLPLAAVEECVELTREAIANTHGRHVINVRGSIVSYIRIRDHFDMPGEAPAVEQIVISEVDGKRIGFVVDNVIGQHQTVIKGLGKMFKNSEEFSGATILGDGTVALILDIQKMVRLVESEESADIL
ncbi:MAG: chemotaxis protein CheA [Magnetococcales bacterium]|nr:chemotaxis protein CheA [Magnetococcales bacterium]